MSKSLTNLKWCFLFIFILFFLHIKHFLELLPLNSSVQHFILFLWSIKTVTKNQAQVYEYQDQNTMKNLYPKFTSRITTNPRNQIWRYTLFYIEIIGLDFHFLVLDRSEVWDIDCYLFISILKAVHNYIPHLFPKTNLIEWCKNVR